MIKEAIILAGGLGTRLRNTVPDVPKCMAPVAGRPFLFYVINFLRMQGIERIIFSLGYKHEIVESYLEEHFPTLEYQTVVEEEPLGTGGAIRLAIGKVLGKDVVIVNGDSLFKTSLAAATALHFEKNAECTLLLKQMENFERYGVVDINDQGRVTGFQEKKFYETGYINAGVYILNTGNFRTEKFPEKFSFETEYVTKMFDDRRIYGHVAEGYFIDIGIPEDYAHAQEAFIRPAFQLADIDENWTLFIDRDGVVNQEKKDHYILNWRDFIFYDGVREAFSALARKFGKLVIVSNQRGVGRGLMSEDDLHGVHRHMEKQLSTAGGRIDRIYYCTSIDNKNPSRKPNPGMAFQAKADFPGIDLSKSIIVGNKMSDMQFGRHAGMFTVFIASTNADTPFPHPDIDVRFDSLAEFAKAL